MPQPYQLLVVDIDGTLLNSRGAISPQDARAIADAVRGGVQVAVSTGRAAIASRTVLDELGLHGYHIFFDGALVSNPRSGHELYAETIEPGLMRDAVTFARGDGLHIDIYSATHYYIERETWAAEIRRSFFRIEPIISNLDAVIDRERIIKGTVIVRTDAEKEKARQFEAAFNGRLRFSWTHTPAYPEVDFINIVNPGVSKGRALEALCAGLDVPLSRVIAIGDGHNDVSLLEKAGMAVAMGNSVAELRAVSDAVTHDVDHGGVAEAVRRYLM